ncbi:uncharacterized protein LOC106871706 [Argonauta hians]
MEKLNTLENNTASVIQEHQLIQKERWDLEKTVKQLNQSLENKKQDHLIEKEKQDEIIEKLKTEIDHKEESWTELRGKCHNLDQELINIKEKLSCSVNSQREELLGWKNTCERLTDALNRKENEILIFTDRCKDLDETTYQLKLEIHSYKDQISTLRSQQQLFHRLKEENRRLLKEKVENEQLIKLLETEKEVLTTTTNREIKYSQRDLAKMEVDLKQANQVNEQLKVTNEVLTEKINASQNENGELREALSKSNIMASIEDHQMLEASYKDLLVEHKQLKEAYLRLVDKEESSQNINDVTNQAGHFTEELNRLKLENENLLSMKQKWEAGQGTDVDLSEELEQTKQEVKQLQIANELLKKESLADVDKDLQQMRQELHQLMGVIKNKDREIETLGCELKASQQQIQSCEETIQQLRNSVNSSEVREAVEVPLTITHSNSTMAPQTINVDKAASLKENGDVFPHEPLAENEPSLSQIIEDHPTVTLRSASVTCLSSVEAATKPTDAPLSPNSDQMHSLIAKYRNPGEPPSSPDHGRTIGRPHSIGPGSSFGGMSRILGLTTPKPFYLSSGAARFNRMSSSSSVTGVGPSSTSSDPSSDPPLATTSPNTTMPSSSFLQSVNSKVEPIKISPIPLAKSPPLPPPRPASRPSSIHSPVPEGAVNGTPESLRPVSPKPQQPEEHQPESNGNKEVEEVRANIIVDV